MKILSEFKGREEGKEWGQEKEESFYCMVAMYELWSQKHLGFNSLSSISGYVTLKKNHFSFQRLIFFFMVQGRRFLCHSVTIRIRKGIMYVKTSREYNTEIPQMQESYTEKVQFSRYISI